MFSPFSPLAKPSFVSAKAHTSESKPSYVYGVEILQVNVNRRLNSVLKPEGDGYVWYQQPFPGVLTREIGLADLTQSERNTLGV